MARDDKSAGAPQRTTWTHVPSNMSQKNRPWSAADTEFVRQHHATMLNRDIAAAVGRSPGAIQSLADRLRLKKKAITDTDRVRQMLAADTSETGLTNSTVRETLGLSRTTASAILHEMHKRGEVKRLGRCMAFAAYVTPERYEQCLPVYEAACAERARRLLKERVARSRAKNEKPGKVKRWRAPTSKRARAEEALMADTNPLGMPRSELARLLGTSEKYATSVMQQLRSKGMAVALGVNPNVRYVSAERHAVVAPAYEAQFGRKRARPTPEPRAPKVKQQKAAKAQPYVLRKGSRPSVEERAKQRWRDMEPANLHEVKVTVCPSGRDDRYIFTPPPGWKGAITSDWLDRRLEQSHDRLMGGKK